MSNHTVPAAAEGLPADTSKQPPCFEGALLDAINLVDLAARMATDGLKRVNGDGATYSYTIDGRTADHLLAVLFATRDSAQAKHDEAFR